MQISNVYKKRIISALLLIVMVTGAGYFIGELLRPVNYSTAVYDAEYKQMKASKSKVDMVFLGASQVMVAFNPKIFEKKLSLHKVFNLSIGQQSMEGMYFQLSEFLDEFQPKTVVIGITHGGLIQKESPKIIKLRMLERLHGKYRTSFIKECLSIDELPYIIPIYGYRGYLFDIMKNVKNMQLFKAEGIYMKTPGWQSMGQGFVVYPKSTPSGNMGIRENSIFDKSMVQDKTIYYLDKCIQLCKEKNVQLFFMTPPTSAANIYETDNYQAMIDYIEDYAKKNNIVYHNLSYLKGKEELLPDSMMYDFKHISKDGSTVISNKYAEILSKSLKNIDTSEYFYPTLTEMKKSVNRIVAVDAKPQIKNNTMTLSVQSLQNDNVAPYYQVLLAKDKKNFNPAVNWTNKKNLSFKVPKSSTYSVLLKARQNENDTNFAWMAWEVDKRGKIRKIKRTSVGGA